MSRASESRRQAIRLVNALKNEGHECSLEINEQGMPQINIIEHVERPVEFITFEIRLGDVAGRLGE
jgi:uncharacterized membrane-anchored protein